MPFFFFRAARTVPISVLPAPMVEVVMTDETRRTLEHCRATGVDHMAAEAAYHAALAAARAYSLAQPPRTLRMPHGDIPVLPEPKDCFFHTLQVFPNMHSLQLGQEMRAFCSTHENTRPILGDRAFPMGEKPVASAYLPFRIVKRLTCGPESQAVLDNAYEACVGELKHRISKSPEPPLVTSFQTRAEGWVSETSFERPRFIARRDEADCRDIWREILPTSMETARAQCDILQLRSS